MSDMKETLVQLIMDHDISAIQILAEKIGADEDTTRSLLEELTAEGKLDGYLTEDGRRYFRAKVDVSHKPTITMKEPTPEFLSYNTRPGRIVAIIGFIIIIAGFVVLSLSGGIMYYENLGLSILLFGVMIALSGCYWIGRRKTPI
ncbi:MAG: hypothetical protein ACFFEF_07110 [Candidatus Thorarchaeota archaeon]